MTFGGFVPQGRKLDLGQLADLADEIIAYLPRVACGQTVVRAFASAIIPHFA